MQKRKISFNWLHLSSMVENEEEFTNVESNLLALLSYISALPKIQRKYNLTKDKFCFIESFSFEENSQCVELLFKSAKHSYRAPLLDKNTVEARENPKRIEEGEQIKTHVLLKFVENDDMHRQRAAIIKKTFKKRQSIFLLRWEMLILQTVRTRKNLWIYLL